MQETLSMMNISQVHPKDNDIHATQPRGFTLATKISKHTASNKYLLICNQLFYL